MRHKREKIDSTNAEALILVQSEPQRASELADWTFKESQELRYQKGQADANKVFALILTETDPALALDFAERAVDLYTRVGDEFAASGLLMSVARFNQNAGWVNRAHYLLNEAYEKATRSGNLKIRAAALFNLGANAEDRNQFGQALGYFTRAKVASEEFQNDHTFWRASAAEQEMHYHLSDGQFNVELVRHALDSLSAEGREGSLIELLVFLSQVAYDSGDSMLARGYLKQSFRLAKRTKNEQAKTEILSQFGTQRLGAGQFSMAIRLFRAVHDASQALGLRTLELTSLKQIAEAQFNLGDANSAYKTIHQYAALKDELNQLETDRHFEEMLTTHQVQLVAEESKQLRRKNTELGVTNERLEAALLQTQKLQKELQRLVTVDELTGSLNRREILARGNDIVARFHSQGRPGAVMIVDIDHFKSINDSFGHATGDEVLRRFTKSCQRVLRPTDSFGRLGGEEFCILLDRTTMDIAEKVAERLLKSIRSTRVSDLMSDRIVTASIGLVEVNSSQDSIEVALHDADTSLYEAKRTGRDKICVNGVKKKKAA